MTVYALLGNSRPDALFARRAGRPIAVETFLRDVAAIARLMPDRGHVINLCRDRYRFTAGLAAALCRGQITLLPPHDSPDILNQLTADYPTLYCLIDDTPPTVTAPVLVYPDPLTHDHAPVVHPSFPAEQPAVVLFTSGSTGRPRPHGRSWGDLVLSAAAAARRLGLAQAELIGTVPHQHSYGLESLVMLALRHGLVLHAERPFFPADILAQLASIPGPRVFVTTPVHLRVLLAEPGARARVDRVICATAPLAQELAREAEGRFGGELHEIYGCSEAGQIAARRTAETEEWHCLDGITLRQDASGTWVSGAPIPVETCLSDVIELRDPERFWLRGRIADLVNIAGKRTSLAHLNHQLNAIEGVTDAAFAMSDEAETTTTDRLIAFAVAPGLGVETILGELRRRIDPVFLPRPLVLVPELPRNALGKLPRAEILRLIAASPRSVARHFPCDHPAADGHFPGNPIIPGAVLIQEIVAAIAGAEAGPCEIKGAKFHHPIRPGDHVTIAWTETEGADIRFTCSLRGHAKPAVTGVLRLS